MLIESTNISIHKPESGISKIFFRENPLPNLTLNKAPLEKE